MNELLKEYKKTRKETREILDNIKQKYNDVRFQNGKDKIKELGIEEKTLLHQYEEDLKIIRQWLSNLNYAIEWIKVGRCPGARRGIDRRATYEREVPFEPYWIQLQKDNSEFNNYETIVSENEEIVAIGQEQKEWTITSITKSLTNRQKEVLELAGNGFSHEEIAKMLVVHKGTISQTLNRAKEKIRQEGWFMP